MLLVSNFLHYELGEGLEQILFLVDVNGVLFDGSPRFGLDIEQGKRGDSSGGELNGGFDVGGGRNELLEGEDVAYFRSRVVVYAAIDLLRLFGDLL